MEETNRQFDSALEICRDLFSKKLHDYGASWRIMRPSSITDQIFIKAMRIRTLETSQCALVDEGILSEYIGIINYGIIGVIQSKLGATDRVDISPDEALAIYDEEALATKELMKRKNHDYGEAWRSMRISSYTDLILTKIARTKQIEDLSGDTLVSEGVDANYRDMVNYAVFAVIRLAIEKCHSQGNNY